MPDERPLLSVVPQQQMTRWLREYLADEHNRKTITRLVRELRKADREARLSLRKSQRTGT